jgi:hypothetical protein
MADLRSRFIEDYAGGLLNISRQELASTGEVLSQDGLLSDSTLFVEDGSGTKSGLMLGTSLCEVVDPTTDQGAVNVRFANRTYAGIRDLKIFSTAIASAQAALADASSSSITNLENAFELLEDSVSTITTSFNSRSDLVDSKLSRLDDLTAVETSLTEVIAEQTTLSNENKVNANSIADINKRINKVNGIALSVFKSYGSVVTISVLSDAETTRTAGTYDLDNISGDNGDDLDLTIVVDVNGQASITSIDDAGANFLAGDIITIPDTDLGSGGASDLSLRVNQVSENITDLNKIIPQFKDLITKVNDIITSFSQANVS